MQEKYKNTDIFFKIMIFICVLYLASLFITRCSVIPEAQATYDNTHQLNIASSLESIEQSQKRQADTLERILRKMK